MKTALKIIAISLIAVSLAGCARVITQNDKQITIYAPPAAYAEAQAMADQHCTIKKKTAVPSGMMFNNTIVYKCE